MKQQKNKHQTREQWLEAAVVLLEPLFSKKDYKLPKVRVSCGFPSSRALTRKRAIGECWASEAAEDKIAQIFISPLIKDSVEVLGVLTHEAVHATVGHKAKHGKVFRACAVAVGLEGKMTSTSVGKNLNQEFRVAFVPKLGQYPHATLKPTGRPTKKQTTRMVKCECENCGYSVRTSRKWLDEAGAPLCPCNKKPMSFEIPPELEPEDED
jgi:hypothetical protein